MSNQFSLSIKTALELILPVAAFATVEKGINEVYKHILITHNGSQCFAIGSNGSQSVIRAIPLPMLTEPFKLCIDGIKLRAILVGLKDCSDQDMTISWTDALATIHVGRSKLTLPVINADGFPNPDKLTDEHFSCVMSASMLLQSLHTVSHACAVRDVRFFLNGCFIKFSENGLTVIGSDGHRISRVIKTVKSQSSSGAEGIVPKKFLELFQSNIDKNTGDVRVRMSAAMIEITFNGGQIRSSLIDGKYPDTTGFFQTSDPTPLFVCSRHAMLQSLSRLKATVFEKLPSIGIELKNNEIKLATLNDKKEESGVDFLAATVTGIDTILSMNINYLSDCLNQIDDDELSFSLCAGNSVKIQSVHNPEFNGVIAQLRR